MLTAGVMGLVKRFRYLLITPALLDLLEPEELKGVVAHEIGHIRKKHLIFYLGFFVGYVVLTVFFSPMAFQPSFSIRLFLICLYAWKALFRETCLPSECGPAHGLGIDSLFSFSFRLFYAQLLNGKPIFSP